ncbi:MAG: hypothetical protein CME65_16060 [Halobacteriovoraceae bacterium]|nr:hypothetical protein [Halobacteriovoraceae bacterium]|tara:strand:- start:25902 stop:28307 length:2406 start_codon:yes stop_codon:yes gene_type:complete
MILRAEASLQEFLKYGGGKATSLKRLKNQGFNVPNFFVIDTRSFKNNLGPLYKRIDQLASEKKFSEIKNLIQEIQLDIKLPRDVFSVFSVRSSANLEDGGKHSFAGIYQTYLNKEDQLDYWIKQCWCGLFSEEHFLYLSHKDIDWKSINMAVIIQEMIIPDYSGIFFQANPNGNINEKIFVLGEGVGEGVVNATVETETITYDLFSKELNPKSQLAVKFDKELNLIINQCSNYQDEKNIFFDFEFCLKDEQIYFLQARPITSVSQNPNIELYDSSNISENYPGVSTPLTLDHLKRLYTVNLSSLLKYLGIPKSTRDKLSINLNEPIESFHGRPYYKVSTWYNLLQSLPLLNGFLTKSWDYMLGVKNIQSMQRIELSIIDQTNILLNVIPKLLIAFLNPIKYERIYQSKYLSFKEKFLNKSLKDHSYDQLLDLYQKGEEAYFGFAQIALFNDLIVGLHLKILDFICKNDPSHLISLSKSNESLESYQLTRSLDQISHYLSRHPKLKEELSHLDQLAKLSDQKLTSMIKAHLEQFGDRTIAEMKLETPSLKEKPEEFLRYLSSLEILDRSKAQAKPLDPLRGWRGICFKLISPLYRGSLAFRENSRFNRVRVKNYFRGILLECDKKLFEANLIKSQNDIFFFKESELFRSWSDQKKSPTDVEARKMQYIKDKKLTLPIRFYLNSPFREEFISSPAPMGSNLKGMGCSPGIVSAPCVVLSQADLKTEIKGKILVTKTTDPGWVLLMMQASGVIVENGNILSHAAIVGRELGIPTIIDCEGVTSRLKTGQLIEMDAHSGVVNILD